jgi:iron-sulfur cluster repair protein YtfE (RIC family)
MVRDHHAIASRVERLDATDPSDVETLQELLYSLCALISVHLRKEEDIQLPAFDAAPEVTARVLERMSADAGHAHRGTTPGATRIASGIARHARLARRRRPRSHAATP